MFWGILRVENNRNTDYLSVIHAIKTMYMGYVHEEFFIIVQLVCFIYNY